MSAQRPPNLAVAQLLCADFSGKSSIRLVENVLAADFDFILEVFADEEEEEAGWGDDNFCFRVERSGIEVVHYICDGLNCAIPEQVSQWKYSSSQHSNFRGNQHLEISTDEELATHDCDRKVF